MTPNASAAPPAGAPPNRRLGWAVGLGLGLVSLAVIGIIAINPAGPAAAGAAIADTTQTEPSAEPAPVVNPYQGGIRRSLTITTRTQTDSLAALLGIPIDSILDPNNAMEPVGAMVGSWPTNRVNVLVRDTFRTRTSTTVAQLADSLGIPEINLRALNQFTASGQIQRGKMILVPYFIPDTAQ